MSLAYTVEGHTWGPRVRARAVVSRIGGTVVGTGEPRPPEEDLDYRRVRWTNGDALDGFDVVIGDPSCVAMRPAGVPGISIRIAGQNDLPRYGAGRPVDLEWDAERYPLHPWASEPLPTREEAVRFLRGTSPDAGLVAPPAPGPASGPLLAVLDQSTTPGVLEAVVREHARGWAVVALRGYGADRWAIGADLLVCPAGWSQVVQARACGVPYVAVEQNGTDHWTRAHCTLAELAVVAANLEPAPAPDPRPRAHVEDHLPAFLDFLESHPQVDLERSST